MQASVVNVLHLNAEKARPPLPFIAIEALLMLLPFAYLQVRTSSFFRYTFSSHYLEFHISIFRRNIFTMHRAYNVDSTTYAYVRVATYWGLMPLLSYVTRQHTLTCELRLLRCKRERVLKCLATYAYVRVATCGRTATCCTCLTGNIRLRANCDIAEGHVGIRIILATYAYVRIATRSFRGL